MPTSLAPQPTENEFDCPRCGTIVPIEVTRCPKCGLNFYAPEADAPTPPPAQPGLFQRLNLALRQWLNLPLPAADEMFAVMERQKELYKSLILKVGGDIAVAQRLIEFERGQKPNANRTVWLQNAIQRWEQDNR